jgi:hypothetical protein
MGRTVPSWRIVVQDELVKMQKFGDSLRNEDKTIFADMLRQCKLYASPASAIASPNKEFQLLMSIIFAQHRRIAALEKQQVLNSPRETVMQDEPKLAPYAPYVV